MFENALVESAGRLKTQSKYWTLAASALNVGVLAVMILLPLLHPEALPKTAMATILVMPTPPPPPAPMPIVQSTPAPSGSQQPQTMTLRVPSIIPTHINESDEPPSSTQPIHIGTMAPSGGDPMGNSIFSSVIGPGAAVAAPKPAGRVHLSTGVAAGYLLVQTQPVYPAIARAAGVHGVVILRAIISKTGTIEDLTVQSGPAMLRQAALDGVRGWRYKPFLLNGEPTDVDTTITVNFSVGG